MYPNKIMFFGANFTIRDILHDIMVYSQFLQSKSSCSLSFKLCEKNDNCNSCPIYLQRVGEEGARGNLESFSWDVFLKLIVYKW